MSFLPPDKVKQGFWIDWSRGEVLGSTLTTNTTTANVVVAILAIVVSLASTHLWHLLLFSFYQIRARNKDFGDGLYRQQQVLFRSSSSAEQALWDFAKLGWTWRYRARDNKLRLFGPALVALLFSVAALAASLTSSFIISTSNITVLVKSNNCGVFNSSDSTFQSYNYAVLNSALNYAKNCYLHDVTSGSCILYVKPRINFTTIPAPCPFSSSICTGSLENPGITLDTGYIDSNDDFGLNAPLEDRVQVRKRTTCAPIKVSGYYTTVDVVGHFQLFGRHPFPGEQSFKIQYGVSPGYQGTFESHFQYDSYLSNFTMEYLVLSQRSGPSYGPTYSTYIPIEQLKRTDADTILVWVFNNAVKYIHPSDDPVFAAHKKAFFLLELGHKINTTVYIPDYPLGSVACAEQYQLCITNSDGLKCTELGGLPMSASAVASLGPNKNQLETFSLLHFSLFSTDMGIVGDSKNSLLAFSTLSQSGIQEAYLPDDQWKHEVNFWESFALSTIQNHISSHAIGPGIKGSDGSEAQFIHPTTAAGKRLCNAQKMMVEGGFANISVFGLAFTIAISGIVVIIDLLLLKILVFLAKFYKFSGFNVNSWIQDGALQLQRKAYEGIGQGNWTRCDKEVPLVGLNDKLFDFKSEPHEKFTGRSPNSTTHNIVTVDTESLQVSSTVAERPIPRGDEEMVTQHADNANATSTATRGSEAGVESTPPTVEEAALEIQAISPV